jgi:predicted CopG family antitoxin
LYFILQKLKAAMINKETQSFMSFVISLKRKKELLALAKKEGRSVSSVIRRLIIAGLDQDKK